MERRRVGKEHDMTERRKGDIDEEWDKTKEIRNKLFPVDFQRSVFERIARLRNIIFVFGFRRITYDFECGNLNLNAFNVIYGMSKLRCRT
jgi:hypothetical protein